MHSALEHQSTSNFHVCFISESFTLKELSSFFSDMRSIGKDKSCVYIQLRDNISESEDRAALQAAGFTTMVTAAGTPKDRDALRKAMQALMRARELEMRAANMGEVTKVALKEIDRLASDRKRGFYRPTPPGFRTLLEFHSNLDTELLRKYFENLMEQSQQALPLIITAIEVPENVLKRKLPYLERSRYFGASHRVWEKLKRMHGKKDPAPAETPAPEAPPGESDEPSS